MALRRGQHYVARLRRVEEDAPAESLRLSNAGTYLISGGGELIESDDGVLAIGSGGDFALAAARALVTEPGKTAKEICQRSLEIAADICVFTNRNITILELGER